MPNGDLRHSGPQRTPQPGLDLNNRDHVRPPGTAQHVTEGLPVYTGRHRRPPHAQPAASDLGTENSGHVLHDTRGVIGDLRVRPRLGIAGEPNRSNAARSTTRHRDASLSIAVDHRDDRLICHFSWSAYTEGDVAQRMIDNEPDPGLVSDEERRILTPPVTAVTAAAGPASVEDARFLLMLAWMLGVYALRRGLGPSPATWIRHEVIDGLLLSRSDLSSATLLTYRSGLRRLRNGLIWMTEGEKAAVRMRASRPPREPYSDRQVDRIRDWILTLSSAYQRRCATALLCLGAGCGLTSSEIGAMRGRGLRVLDSGAVVLQPAGSDRIIACRGDFEADLALLADEQDAFLFAPSRTVDQPVHLISNIVDRMPRGRGVPRLDTRRARTTWIVSLLRDHVPHEVVAKAAGMTSIEPLARYQHWVPPIDEQAELRMLRGTPWR